MSLANARLQKRMQGKALPPLPLRSSKIELETSHSREGLVLENAKLREQIQDVVLGKNQLIMEVEVLRTQVTQYSVLLKEYQAFVKNNGQNMNDIAQSVKDGMKQRKLAVRGLDTAQAKISSSWDDYVQEKRSSGVSVDDIVQNIKHRVTSGENGDIDIGLQMNMI